MKYKLHIASVVMCLLLSACTTKVENTVNVINVGDQRAPEITLDKEIHIEEGTDFNLEDYCSVKDDREIVNVVASNPVDTNSIGSYTVTLTATDEKGNFSIVTSKVYVEPAKEEIVEEVSKPINVVTNNKPVIKPSSSPENEEYIEPNKPQASSSPEPPVYVPPTPRSPFIDGVRDISVSIDTDPQLILSILAGNVTASGSVWIDITEVNTSEEGSYTAYYNSTDGVSESCTVYVN